MLRIHSVFFYNLVVSVIAETLTLRESRFSASGVAASLARILAICSGVSIFPCCAVAVFPICRRNSNEETTVYEHIGLMKS